MKLYICAHSSIVNTASPAKSRHEPYHMQYPKPPKKTKKNTRPSTTLLCVRRTQAGKPGLERFPGSSGRRPCLDGAPRAFFCEVKKPSLSVERPRSILPEGVRDGGSRSSIQQYHIHIEAKTTRRDKHSLLEKMVTNLHLGQHSAVAENHGHFRVLWTKKLFPNGLRPLVERLSLSVLALECG